MIEITVDGIKRLVSKESIVYAFGTPNGSELSVLFNAREFITVSEAISVFVSKSRFIPFTVKNITYCVNATNVREVRQNRRDNKCAIITAKGVLEPQETYSEIANRFLSVYSVAPGPYSGDAAAAAAGIEIGEIYRLSQINDYDIPSSLGRMVVARIQ